MIIFSLILLYLIIGVIFWIVSGAWAYSDTTIMIQIVLTWPYWVFKWFFLFVILGRRD